MVPRKVHRFVLAWAAFAAVGLALAWMASGGWGAWVSLDPLGRPDLPAAHAVPAKGRYVAWMGDSVCGAQKTWSPEDLLTPPLGKLVAARLFGSAGILGSEWRFLEDCRAGTSGPGFEAMARAFCSGGRAPDIAVIPVNIRSLNTLGENGFMGPPQAPADPAALAVAKARPVGWRRRWIQTFGEPGAALRGLAAWGRGCLRDALVPAKLTGGETARAADPQEERDGYLRIYGKGFELHEPTLTALLAAGEHLRSCGSRVFYYATPAERKVLVAQLGPGVLEQRDRAAARAVEALRGAGFEVLDLQAAREEGFYEAPSEHLDAAARLWLADRLTAWLGERLQARPL